MPKIIELTVELNVQKVSCPGVWLCQDGRVSLSIFALGTSYQTCMLPPVFPLMFKDVFYFRKRYQENCALNNICCLLKDETIYCELLQWCEDCMTNECTILAQYLGALNDVLFPPNMCSNEGVDLLMRRSSEFPGILSPKIEISTKVRIDEVWDQNSLRGVNVKVCGCENDADVGRQRQVCHSTQYHRNMCPKSSSKLTPESRSRLRVRSAVGSTDARSCCSLARQPSETKVSCPSPKRSSYMDSDYDRSSSTEDKQKRPTIESRFIEECNHKKIKNVNAKLVGQKITPCVCEICKRYHELFHM